MKIVSSPPKTGEEFAVSWVDSSLVVYSKVMRFNKEWQMYEIRNSDGNWLSVIGEQGTFKGTTILVSKGE